MEPNSLLLHHPEQPLQTYRTGTPAVSNAAAANTRVPAGHPEGYLEAFANIYRNFALALRAQQAGKKPDELMDYPTVTDGLRGMKFVEKAVESDGHGQVWVDI
jgi:predicted dehydrogenase